MNMEKQPTEAQKAEFRRAFSIFDTNNDGHISSSELAEVMKQLGRNMSQAELDAMLKEVDSDKNGTIEFNEFCVYMLNQLTKPQDIRRKTFEACDRDRNGLISAEEFVEVMKLMGDDTITLDQAKAMIKKVDKDGNEQISYDEFIVLLDKK
ncbi:PREDICTED: squidulin-like [Amphimedon queenslandica]|uniref:EF-hand domain-containing protein n=1 Tax=Amphimedon queenslandica TaxID=400682 RepID=A0A1X7VUK2_AMPQE|nr:PREDICTED: squidulin-like [Amphimedon queenslandica]|eukprot:XP_011403658.1 PREDICTED: squidulin-like [Amphimedon queenslandica]